LVGSQVMTTLETAFQSLFTAQQTIPQYR